MSEEMLVKSISQTDTALDIASEAQAIARKAIAQRDELAAALRALNHMGGDERGGYCICPMNDGSAPDNRHASGCRGARTALSRLSDKGEA